MPFIMMLQRVIRRVPLHYEHPRDDEGHFRPKYAKLWDDVMCEWLAGWEKWKRGEHEAQSLRYTRDCDSGKVGELVYPPGTPYVEYEAPPGPEYYRTRPWPEGAEMGIQMYEDVSEGTPISKVYPDTEDGRLAMARELAENPKGITKGMTVDEWLKVIDGELFGKDIHTGKFE